MIRFRNALASLALLVAAVAAPLAGVRAQSSPGLVYGQVPTAAQWNSYFSLKQDALLLPPNSILGNTTASSQSVRYMAMPSTCTGANDALIWVPNVGWTCHTIAGGGTINPGAANALAYYAGAGNTLSAIASINSGTLVTNGSGVPSLSLTLPATVQGNISTVGTIASGAWHATPIDVIYGGTGISVFTSGGIPYASSTTTIASSGLLAANGVVVGGGAGAAPATIATANNGVLVTSGGGVPSIGSTLPTAVMNNITRTGTLVAGSTGSGFTVAVGTSTVTGVLPSANGGAGSITGALKANGAGVVTQAACSDLSNGATGCSTATGTSGATIPLLNGTNTWSGVQSFSVNDLVAKGSTSGTLTLNAAAIAGTGTLTFPAGTTDFSATGGASQVVKQTSSGGAFTVARLACSDLSDSGTGCTTTVGTAASAATGTSGHTLGFLDGANTWSALQTHSAGVTMSAATLTMADGATWGTTGLANSQPYTGVAPSPVGFGNTVNYSSTSNGVNEYTFVATLVPTGASAGTNSSVLINPTMGTSAVNISRIAGLQVGVNTAAGYSGTAANGTAILVAAPTASGTNPFTAGNSVTINGATNGGAITTGTVTNNQINIIASTAAAGSGGTVVNNGIFLSVPSGSAAGNTNKGLYVTGNGGGLSTNYAIYSDSTAASLLSGILQLPNGTVGAPSLNLGDATTGLYRVASGQIGIASGGVLQGTWLSTGLTMNANTLTFGDGATWSSTGLSDTATYTTANTATLTFSPTWNFSSTSNGVGPIAVAPVLKATGASAGNVNATAWSPHVGSASVNFGDFRGLNINLFVDSGYTGTIAGAESIRITDISNSGTNAVTTYRGIQLLGSANGNGVTSGSITNTLIDANASTASAAAGGTVTNNTIIANVSSGSGAGTTTNKGLVITGNGGSGGGGTTTNYALYSDSTAASALAGGLAIGTTSTQGGGLSVTGNLANAIVSSANVYFSGSTAFFRSYGANASTYAGIAITQSHGDGSTALTSVSWDTSGVASFPQTTNLGTGSTNWVTAAGGSNPTISTGNGGKLVLGSNNNNVFAEGSSGMVLGISDSSQGSDLKRWGWNNTGGNIVFNAFSDNWGSSTSAYQIARGTTYNVASHTWYTSTSAGTPVQKMQITATAQTIVNPLSLSGGLSVGGAAGTGGLAVTSAISGNAASSANLDYSSGDARLISIGADASTNGTFNVLSLRSDGSNAFSIFTSSSAGVVTSALPWTLSNTTIKLSGITTGTNADFLCRASDGTVLLQTSSCTISTRALKIDLGRAPFDPAAALRKIDVAYFRYKDAAVSTGDVVNAGKPETGLYAEDVAAAIPGSAVYWEDGKTVKSYRQPAVLAALVGGWNAHDVALGALRAANDDLRAANDDLRRRVESLEARR